MPKGIKGFQKSNTPWNKGKTGLQKHSKETKKKMSIMRKGKPHFCWKGGRYINDGYIFVKNPEHPFCNKLGYIREHRLVMEKHLGRYLKLQEVVHHINGNRKDNRIENLKFFTNELEHRKFHNRDKLGKFC